MHQDYESTYFFLCVVAVLFVIISYLVRPAPWAALIALDQKLVPLSCRKERNSLTHLYFVNFIFSNKDNTNESTQRLTVLLSGITGTPWSTHNKNLGLLNLWELSLLSQTFYCCTEGHTIASVWLFVALYNHRQNQKPHQMLTQECCNKRDL